MLQGKLICSSRLGLPIEFQLLLAVLIPSTHLSLTRGITMSKKQQISTSSIFFDGYPDLSPISQIVEPLSTNKAQSKTAIVYCDGHFGGIDGKTANGLVRHSEKYKILSIIDSDKAGQDAGEVLDGEPTKIPIYRDLGTALAQAGRTPNYFIFGIAPASGGLSPIERRLILRAIGYGMNIVHGHHELLNDDPEFAAASAKANVTIS